MGIETNNTGFTHGHKFVTFFLSQANNSLVIKAKLEPKITAYEIHKLHGIQTH